MPNITTNHAIIFTYQSNLDSGSQSLKRFRIPWAAIPVSIFQDSGFHKQIFPDSGLHRQNFVGFWNPDSLTRGEMTNNKRSCATKLIKIQTVATATKLIERQKYLLRTWKEGVKNIGNTKRETDRKTWRWLKWIANVLFDNLSVSLTVFQGHSFCL